MVKRLAKRLADLHLPHEAALLRRAAAAAGRLPLGLLPKDYLQQMQLLTKTVNDLEGLAVSLGRARDVEIVAMSADDLTAALSGDAPPPEDELAVRVAAALYGAYREDRDARSRCSRRGLALGQAPRGTAGARRRGRGVLPRCERLPAAVGRPRRGLRRVDAVVHTRHDARGLVDKHLEATLASAGKTSTACRAAASRCAGEAGRAVRERSGGGGDAG